MSYADLLQSTPASTLPLSQLTSAASADPPPHLPTLVGGAHELFGGSPAQAGSAASSVRGLVVQHGAGHGHGHGFGGAGASHAAARGRESALPGAGEVGGGEWEREGMGMGLEERLEALMGGAPREGVVGGA